MSKKLDWDSLSTPFGSRALPGASKPKYTSGRDLLAKAYAQEEERERRAELLAKAEPGMAAILQYRMLNRLPITVNQNLQYKTSELVKSDSSAYFRDSIGVIHPGTVLTPVSIDPTMQEFIFKSQAGEEYAINFADQRQLYLCTDIYNFVFNHLKGE